MHKLSDTYATVNVAGIDTGAQADTDEAVYCNSLLTAHIPAISRHYSACRTTPLGLFCKLRGGATQTCKPAAAPAPLAAGSSQNQLQAGCDDLQDHSTGLPAFLSHHVNPRETTRTLRSSDTLLLTVPFTRTELAKRAFRCAAPSVWNSLPSFIINSSSLPTFKSRLKTYFFRLSFDCSVHV